MKAEFTLIFMRTSKKQTNKQKAKFQISVTVKISYQNIKKRFLTVVIPRIGEQKIYCYQCVKHNTKS